MRSSGGFRKEGFRKVLLVFAKQTPELVSQQLTPPEGAAGQLLSHSESLVQLGVQTPVVVPVSSFVEPVSSVVPVSSAGDESYPPPESTPLVESPLV
jgi:hypothetical protein